MGLEATRNVILSAGGKHGAGGTILRGQPVPAEVAQFLPVDAVAPTGLPAALAARQTPLPPPVTPTAKAPAPIEPAAPEVPSVPEAVEPPAAPTPAAPTPAKVDEAAIPTTRKKLMAMNRDQVVRVCADLGLTFAADAAEREIKDRLARELGL